MARLEDYLRHTYIAPKEEHEEALHMRYLHACIWNPFLPDRGDAQKSMGDKYDEFTDYLLCRGDGNEIAGLVRLVRPNAHGYFMDQFVNPRDFLTNQANTLEISEVLTHRDYRRDPKIIMCLGAGIIKYILKNKYSGAMSISVPGMHKVVSSLGFTKTDITFMSGWQEYMTLFVNNDVSNIGNKLSAILPKSAQGFAAAYIGE